MAAKIDGWVRDPKQEDVLKELGLKYTVGSIFVTDIDFKKTLENPARTSRSIDVDTVEDYKAAMLAGKDFPYVIVIRAGARFVTVGGVHRSTSAKEAGRTVIGAYIVEDELLPGIQRMLALKSNRVEGRRSGREEAVLTGISLVQEDNLEPADVAKMLCIDVKYLRRHLQGSATRDVAIAAGFRGSLAPSAWQHLSKVKNTNVLVALANFCHKHKLSLADTKKVANEVTSKKSTEAQQIAFLEEYDASQFSREGRGGSTTVKLPVRSQFIGAISRLESVIGTKSLQQLQIARGSEEHTELKRRVNKLQKVLKNVLA